MFKKLLGSKSDRDIRELQPLVDRALQEWEEILPGEYFQRIHRSALVNFAFVERVEKCRNYSHLVHVRGVEKPLVMSRRYSARLHHLLPL